MADDIQVNAGTGPRVATDERTVGAQTVHVQRVDEQGATAIATGQVTLTSSGPQIAAARETRKRILIRNHHATEIAYIGVSGLSTANGFLLPAATSVELYTTAAVHGRRGGTVDVVVSYLEEYDA